MSIMSALPESLTSRKSRENLREREKERGRKEVDDIATNVGEKKTCREV